MSVPKVAAVIGVGPMGPGMAAVLARAGSEASADYLRHLVAVHARRALGEAFASAS